MASSRVYGARIDQFLQQAAEPAFWLTRDLRLIWVNRAWEELTGHSASEALGLVCQAHGPMVAGDLQSLGGSLFPPSEALAGTPSGSRTLFLHPSGERRWRRVDYWPIHNERREVTALLGLIREGNEPGLTPDSEAHRLRTELMELRHRLVLGREPEGLIGRGPAHRRLLEQIKAAAASNVAVLIVGEPGTGKRHVARSIHQSSPRRQSPFLAFDAQALPPELLERELFGGFNGLSEGVDTLGRRSTLPEGSTLLIRDVFDLPRDLQRRIAESLDEPYRLMATSVLDPRSAVSSERARPDLYFAVTALVIELSPLRDRLEELPVLAQHFLERANLREGRQRSGFSPEAIRVLLSYDWPGNLRELARVIDVAQAAGTTEAVVPEDLPAAIRGSLASSYSPPAMPATVTPLDEILTRVERHLIENALVKARGNKSKAAELLGISRPRLYRRIKDLGLPEEPEPTEELPAGSEEGR
ncbi:MAG: sigma 54-interacting transcriptional regulator [Isosphaeraceae bacterium]